MPLHPQAKAMIEAFSEGPALGYSTLTAPKLGAAFGSQSNRGAARRNPLTLAHDRLIRAG